MSIPSDADLKRWLRVIAAWTNEDQASLASTANVPSATLKNYFAAGKPAPPLELVLKLADHAEIPRSVVLDGWSAVEHDEVTERRLAAIEAHIGLR